MRPLDTIPDALARRVQGLLFDVDDTLTTGGRLTARAYRAVERLHEAGMITIPVTGRPAGWCDHIARMWPVDAVVGENGAFWFRYDREARRMHRRYVREAADRARDRERLDALCRRILAAVPGAAVAADQAYRESDLAIDWCEDVPRLAEEEVERIVETFRAAGARAKVSSIHVNGWFGDFDKLTTARALLAEAFDAGAGAQRERFAFVGDSPNDAPMFAFFPVSIGVANVRAFAARIDPPPAWVTGAQAGAGFAEAADCLLAARGCRS